MKWTAKLKTDGRCNASVSDCYSFKAYRRCGKQSADMFYVGQADRNGKIATGVAGANSPTLMCEACMRRTLAEWDHYSAVKRGE